MKASIVVPTFNRGPVLVSTLHHLLASDLSVSDSLEVLVVDDGSATPAEQQVSLPSSVRIPVHWIRQGNAGPAAARNAGFRRATGEIVLFVDDDVLVPPHLVAAHLALHQAHPAHVVYGPCEPLPQPLAERLRLVPYGTLPLPPAGGASPRQVTLIASGHLSIERRAFPDGAVYDPDLRTPAAEEFELAARLRARKIPVLLASHAVAWHDEPADVLGQCRIQYKHGLGIGEVAALRPWVLTLPELAQVVERNRAAEGIDPPCSRARRTARALLTSPPARRLLVWLARIAPRSERTRRAAVAAHFIAGIRDGIRLFAPAPGPGLR